jgi:hypothetical protein
VEAKNNFINKNARINYTEVHPGLGPWSVQAIIKVIEPPLAKRMDRIEGT